MTFMEIHEFSTGIQVQGTPDNWYSTGFSGAYMNQTIDLIPVTVRRAIHNLELALAQGASKEEPAIIGREVVGDNGEGWSVVAVITQGRDDRDRGTPLYRYFLTQGIGNLGHILSWMKQYQTQHGRIPTFDPFDSKTLGQPNLYDTANTKTIQLTPKFQACLTQEPPIIIPFDQSYAFIILNTLATQKAQQNGKLVSWAHEVEELAKPMLFQAIQPASAETQAWLEQIKEAPPPLPPALINEEDLKSAISGLINNPTIDLQLLQIFLNSLTQANLQDQQYDEFWTYTLNGLGGRDLKEHHYPNLAKFLILKTIIFPDALGETLKWMETKKKRDDYQRAFVDFQKNILEYIKHKDPQNQARLEPIISRLKQGVSSLVAGLPKNPEILNSTVDLLNSTQGLWSYYCPMFVNYLDKQLTEIGKPIKRQNILTNNIVVDDSSSFSNHRLKEIFEQIVNHWGRNYNIAHENYRVLAELFEKLFKGKTIDKNTNGNALKISALFYQVALGKGKVPKKIFDRLDKLEAFNPKDVNCRIIENEPFKAQIYRLTVEREKSVPEKLQAFWQEIDSKVVPLPLSQVLLLILLFFILGIPVGALLKTPLEKFLIGAFNLVMNAPGNISKFPCQSLGFFCPDSKITTAVNNFSQTEKSLEKLKGEEGDFVQYLEKTSNEVENAILIILKETVGENLSFDNSGKPEDIEKWVEAIIVYQEKVVKLGDRADGIIYLKLDTFNVLKCQVAKELNVPLSAKTFPKICKKVLQKSQLPEEKPQEKPQEVPSSPKTTSLSPQQSPTQLSQQENAFKKRTKEALQNMIDELAVAGTGKSKLEIERTIAEILTLGEFINLQEMEQNISTSSEKIKEYQSNKSSGSDGVIDLNQNTYKHLKCDVADRLNIALNPRPDICQSKPPNNSRPEETAIPQD